MKTTIVLTTIQHPTYCVEKWAKLKPDQVIAVGDRKTPSDWKYKGVKFIGIDEQANDDFSLSKVLPENHYCRKMMGYLVAAREGTEVMFDTDDDNEPYTEFWSDTVPVPSENEYAYILDNQPRGFINPYSLYTTKENRIWPRGLPLEKIRCKEADLSNISEDSFVRLGEISREVGIWQGLVDGDPDVDAIHRLIYGVEIDFLKKKPLVLSPCNFAPFNSQNTAWVKTELFPLLYLPTSVSFRYTDILRGYVALAIMEKYNLRLGFTPSTAKQIRNDHNLISDFESEVPMYTTSTKVMENLNDVTTDQLTITENIEACYIRLNEMNITSDREMKCLQAWINDINRF